MTKQSIFETYGDEPTILDGIEHAKKQKDWTGSKGCLFKIISATSHGSGEREANDYYATDPKCAHDIINILNPDKDTTIWEPACGEGHLSKEFEKLGFNVISSDLIDRGYGTPGVDFLKAERPSVDGKLLIATNPPYKCFSSDTECYTKSGWKKYTELKKDDEILSVNPETLRLEWSKIKEIVEKECDDKMYHFNKSHLDLMVTKDHRMFAFRKGKLLKNEGDLIKSQNIRSEMYCPRVGFSWNGETHKTFVLPAVDGFKYAQPVHKPEIEIDSVAWIKFFAFWLADGYCRHTKNTQGNPRKTVGIKQGEKTSNQVREILKNLPFKWNEYVEVPKTGSTKINFEIHNEQLWSYLKQFGTSKTKFVPEWIKECNTEFLNLFLEYYLKGDGSKLKNGVNVYRTISKKLAEDVQEMLLKCGYLSHITTSNDEKNKNPMYLIYENRGSIYNKYFYPSNKNEQLVVDYKGKVWCPILEKNGVFLCRRNGKEIFSGNCAQEFVEHSLELLNDGEQAAFFLKLTFLEGQKRQRLFKKLELESVNVYVKRAVCVINGDFENVNNGGAVAYAWFVFKKGNGKQPVVEWI